MTEKMVQRRKAGEALADRLLGLPEETAASLADSEGLPLRVARRDGKPLLLRADLRPGRLNVDVTDGTVTAVRVEREPGA